MLKSSVLILIFLFVSCGNNKWDPDLQYQQQSAAIQLKQNNHLRALEVEAVQSLRDLESRILVDLKAGENIYTLNDLLGLQYKVLAQNFIENKLWEQRLYLWENIVSSCCSLDSLQFRLCQKNRDFVTLTINGERIVNVEFL